MRILHTIIIILLTGLLYTNSVSAQAQNSNSQDEKELSGIWGMFKDRHPDGWASWNPPYEYLEFIQDSKYIRTYLNKKGNSIIIGTYKLVNDSLLIFNESIATNGIDKGKVKADTARLYSLKTHVLEVWQDWDRILWKSVKKWGHKKKFRPLTLEEKVKYEAVTRKLINDYSLIKESGEK